MFHSARWRGARLTLAAVVAVLSTAAKLHATPVEVDFLATSSKYAATPASSASSAIMELSPALAVKDQEDYSRYVQWQRDYSRRGWEWHLFSTQFLFAMVMAIVAFGLWLTHRQFQRDYLQRQDVPLAAESSPSTAPDLRPLPAPSTLKLGPAGLELTSQVVGLLVLAVSIAFFYFYVKEVYPMREVERGASATASAPAR